MNEIKFLLVVDRCIDVFKEREYYYFRRNNIILIDKWRVIIVSDGHFLIFDGLYLASADLVVDCEFDGPSVFELVERVIG
jgi:hypothetical protein